MIIKLYRTNLSVRTYSVLPNTDKVLGDIAVGINYFQNILITRVYAEYKNIVKEIKQYQKKWLQHVQRMDTNRLPKVATTCTEDGHKQTTKSGYNTYRGWTQTGYQNMHYNINQRDEGT